MPVKADDLFAKHFPSAAFTLLHFAQQRGLEQPYLEKGTQTSFWYSGREEELLYCEGD